MGFKLLIGAEPWLSLATSHWAAASPSQELRMIELKLDQQYQFDFEQLDSIGFGGGTAFVAWGYDFLNFQRWELFGALKYRGYKMPPLIHPTAHVGANTSIAENVWIREMVTIGPNTEIGENAVLSTAVSIGSNCRLMRNIWISERSIIGQNCVIGQNSFFGTNAVLSDSIKIGRYSFLETSDPILSDVPEKTFNFRNNYLTGRVYDYS